MSPILGGRGAVNPRGFGWMGAGKPNAPTIGAATNVGTGRAYNNGSATVAFTAGSDNGAPITSFTVTSSPGGYTASGASSPLVVTGLQSATSYTFTVTATNSVGTSDASSASSAITATTVPQAPTIGTATCATGQAYTGSASISVPFTAGATGGQTISGYNVTSSSTNTGSGASSPISVSETVGNPTSTARTYTVTATNVNGTSAASSASNSIAAVSKPQTPTIGTATRTGNTTVSQTFTAGATGGSAITSYTAVSSPSISLSTSGTSSPVTITGTFVQGTGYTFTVAAVNAFGTSNASGSSNSVTPFPAPTLGAWSATTSYPYDNQSAGVGGTTSTAQFWVGGRFDGDLYNGDGYTWNGSGWSVRTSLGVGFPGTTRIDSTRVSVFGGVATYGYYYENRVWAFDGTTQTQDTNIPYTSYYSGVASVTGGLCLVAGNGGSSARYYKNSVFGGTWTLGTTSPFGSESVQGMDLKDFTNGIFYAGTNTSSYTVTSNTSAFTAATLRPSSVPNNSYTGIGVINNQTLFFKGNDSNLATYLFNGSAYTQQTDIPTATSTWWVGAVGTNISAVKGTTHYRATLS